MIEAVEVDRDRHSGRWAVAVQWHPEERLDDLRVFARWSAPRHDMHPRK